MSKIKDIWTDFMDFESVKVDTSKKVTFKGYPLVPTCDIEPVCVIEPTPKGPWIAGGSCLRWYEGKPVGGSDIDIFCANAIQAEQTISRIKSYGRFHIVHQSENAITLDYDAQKDGFGNVPSWKMQVIIKRWYSSLQEVIDNFDISVCQIGTDGERWLLGEHTAKDIRERNLRMKYPLQPDAVKRLGKYWTYGYRPVDGLLDSIIESPDSRWVYEGHEDY